VRVYTGAVPTVVLSDNEGGGAMDERTTACASIES
jgi:hypothetical protein